MLRHKYDQEDPSATNPILTGLATFVSFLIFGIIPLLPYIILSEGDKNVFYASIAATFTALLLLGLLKAKILKQSKLRSILEMVAIGGVAASVAFGVGVLFK